MRSWLRAVELTGVAALLTATVGASGGVTVVEGALHHGRDEAAFQDYVVTYIGGHADGGTPEDEGAVDTAWARANPEAVLAAGNVACDWLADQPVAPRIDPTGETSFFAVATRYSETLRPVPGPVSEAGLSSVTAGAWEYLCWTDRELRTAPQSTSDD